MNCPYCKNPGFARQTDIYSGDTATNWICVKCPNPVTYSAIEKKVAIWVLYNGHWYSIVYMENKKEYLVNQESFDLRVNQAESREEWVFNGQVAIQLPSEENVTPENAAEKLALWLTFS